jgi:hypothetical protein
MSAEDSVEATRERLGYDAAKRGDPLHESASDTFKTSYKGFGSNVVPKRFGAGGEKNPDWKCVCGNVNPGNRTKRIARREVCWLCETEREFGEDRDEA